jgi:hypothetical protein
VRSTFSERPVDLAGDVDGGVRLMDEKPLRTDGLHPRADVAHEDGDPKRAEILFRRGAQAEEAGVASLITPSGGAPGSTPECIHVQPVGRSAPQVRETRDCAKMG